MQDSTFRPNPSFKECHLLFLLPSPALRLYQPSAGIIHKRHLGSTGRDQRQSLMYVMHMRKEKLRNLYFLLPSYQNKSG